MEIKIEKATMKDLDSITTFNNKLFDLEIENYDPYLIKNWPKSKEGIAHFSNAIKNCYVIIAKAEDKIVGYLSGAESKNLYKSFKQCELEDIYIEEEYRKHGVGKLLVNTFVNYFKNKGIQGVVVSASAKNHNAINFYENVGFEKIEVTLLKML